MLQSYAHLMHVERAAAHRRIHCVAFSDLDAQSAWLIKREGLLVALRVEELAL